MNISAENMSDLKAMLNGLIEQSFANGRFLDNRIAACHAAAEVAQAIALSSISESLKTIAGKMDTANSGGPQYDNGSA